MKVILQDNNQFVLRLDKDEELLESLTKFLSEQGLKACAFYGIGSCTSVELGYYNTHLKDFRKKPFFDNMEILSLEGTGAIKDGQPIVHAHGIFGRIDFTTIGGHIFKMVVSATCEIYVTQLNGELKRELNEDFNLNTLV